MNETEPPEDDIGDAVDGADERPVGRFIHDHPGMAIAGGIALGVLAAALLPKRNREFVAGKSSAFADTVSAAGLMLFREALERAEAAGEGGRGLVRRIGEAAARKSVPPASPTTARSENPEEGQDFSELLVSVIRYLRGRLRD